MGQVMKKDEIYTNCTGGSPSYYSGDWRVGDFIMSNNLDFFQGNILKYLFRWKEKGGVHDLIKARNYLDYYIRYHEDKAGKNMKFNNNVDLP